MKTFRKDVKNENDAATEKALNDLEELVDSFPGYAELVATMTPAYFGLGMEDDPSRAKAALRTVLVGAWRIYRRLLHRAWAALQWLGRHLRDWLALFNISGLPWILGVLLVVLFVLAGLKELYYDNTTFGSEPVLNYGALVLWGIAATAVNIALGKVLPDPASG